MGIWKQNKFGVVILLLLNLHSTKVYTQKSFSDVKTALENNVVYYFENGASLRPVSDISDVINVELDLNIAAVNDFNEQNGFIEISGYLNMEWTPTEGQAEMDIFEEFVGNSFLWKPPIILVNSVQKAEEIGWDTNVDVRYNFKTLKCSWRPWIIARAACTPDVQYYPFDKQACSFKFVAWGYNSSELLITASSTSLSFNFFEENGEWTMGASSSSAYVENGASVVEYKLKLTRRPTYYVINLIAPIILLAILNVLVFILPPDSGERIGYSITCFLSYVVLLNTVMAFLPTSAAPLAYLSYYTFVMMVFSAGMSLATVITLRIHFKPKDEPVSPAMEKFIFVICCKWLKKTKKIKPKPVQHTSTTQVTSISWDDDDTELDDNQAETTRSESIADTDNDNREEKCTWEHIAYYMDILFFLGFLTGQIFYSAAYLIPIVLNA